MARPRFRLRTEVTMPTTEVLVSPKSLYRKPERLNTPHLSYRNRQEAKPLPSLRCLITDTSPLRISVCKPANSLRNLRFRLREKTQEVGSTPKTCGSEVEWRSVERKTMSTPGLARTNTRKRLTRRKLRRTNTAAVQRDPWVDFSAWD